MTRGCGSSEGVAASLPRAMITHLLPQADVGGPRVRIGPRSSPAVRVDRQARGSRVALRSGHPFPQFEVEVRAAFVSASCARYSNLLPGCDSAANSEARCVRAQMQIDREISVSVVDLDLARSFIARGRLLGRDVNADHRSRRRG